MDRLSYTAALVLQNQSGFTAATLDWFASCVEDIHDLVQRLIRSPK